MGGRGLCPSQLPRFFKPCKLAPSCEHYQVPLAHLVRLWLLYVEPLLWWLVTALPLTSTQSLPLHAGWTCFSATLQTLTSSLSACLLGLGIYLGRTWFGASRLGVWGRMMYDNGNLMQQIFMLGCTTEGTWAHQVSGDIQSDFALSQPSDTVKRASSLAGVKLWMAAWVALASLTFRSSLRRGPQPCMRQPYEPFNSMTNKIAFANGGAPPPPPPHSNPCFLQPCKIASKHPSSEQIGRAPPAAQPPRTRLMKK